MQTRGIQTTSGSFFEGKQNLKEKIHTTGISSVGSDKLPKQAANSISGVGCFYLVANSRTIALAAIAMLFSLFLSGCQTDRTALRPDLAIGRAPTYLAAGDVIKLSFPGAPEFNQSQKIRPDGRISLPLIGEVDAAGSSIGEFQAKLARLYKSQLENTEVVVALENRAIPVYVCGAVNRPGKVVIDRPVSALEAIMEAGGFSQTTADMSRVHLIRIENGRHTTRILNLRTALRSQLTVASYVKPYDVIYVPESLF